jgi:hypothetical protein
LFIILTTVISRRKNQEYIVSVTVGAKYLTGMVTSVPPYENFSLIKNVLHQSKIYKSLWKFKFLRYFTWPKGHIGHVTYSFKIMLFISTGIFDDKLRPQIVSVVPTANAPLTCFVIINCFMKSLYFYTHKKVQSFTVGTFSSNIFIIYIRTLQKMYPMLFAWTKLKVYYKELI